LGQEWDFKELLPPFFGAEISPTTMISNFLSVTKKRNSLIRFVENSNSDKARVPYCVELFPDIQEHSSRLRVNIDI
jgi:hypothetical protein